MFDQLKCTAESCQKINKICLGIPEYLHDILQNDKELFLCCEALFHLMNEVGKRYFCLKSSKDLSVFGDFADPWRGMGGREGNDEAFFGPVIFLQ